MKKSFGIAASLICLSIAMTGQERNLDFYVKEGLERSPLLKDYINQYNSVSFDSMIVRAEKKPQVEAKSQLLYTPVYTNFGYDEVITDGGNYQAVVGVSQDIFRRKEIDNKLEALNIRKESIINDTKLSRNELVRLITDQYLSSYLAFNNLNFNRSFLELLNRQNNIVKQLVVNGIYRQTDYLSLQIETQTQEILVNQLLNEYASSLRELNRICGIDDSVSYTLNLPGIEVRGIPEVAKTPGYLQYKIDSLRIINEKAAIDVRYKLKVNWFADAGFLAHDPLSFYNYFGYSAGLGLSIPIYDGNQRNIEKQKLTIAENTRANYLNNYRVQYNQKIRQLNDELKSLRENSSRLEIQMMTSEKLLVALKSELETGLIQMTDYLIAVKNYRFINKNLNETRINILKIINDLNYLVTQY